MNLVTSVQGFYKIEAVNAETKQKRLVADWFPNLITNNGLNAMATTGVLARCMVGAGSTPPSVSDTTLQSQIAATTSVQSTVTSSQSSAPYYGSTQRTYRFAAGAAAGNLSEVGVGWLSGGSDLCFSRALILDSFGFPTTITILSNEFLDVTYELRCYVPTSDVVMLLNLNGTDHTCTIRPAQATNANVWAPSLFSSGITLSPGSPQSSAYSGSINASVTGSPSGTSANGSNSNLSYENNSLTIKGYTEWGLTEANFGAGGIQAITFVSKGLGAYQVGFSPAIPKDNTKTFRIDYGISWARR